jgi:hypothetical protein
MFVLWTNAWIIAHLFREAITWQKLEETSWTKGIKPEDRPVPQLKRLDWVERATGSFLSYKSWGLRYRVFQKENRHRFGQFLCQRVSATRYVFRVMRNRRIKNYSFGKCHCPNRPPESYHERCLYKYASSARRRQQTPYSSTHVPRTREARSSINHGRGKYVKSKNGLIIDPGRMILMLQLSFRSRPTIVTPTAKLRLLL